MLLGSPPLTDLLQVGSFSFSQVLRTQRGALSPCVLHSMFFFFLVFLFFFLFLLPGQRPIHKGCARRLTWFLLHGLRPIHTSCARRLTFIEVIFAMVLSCPPIGGQVCFVPYPPIGGQGCMWWVHGRGWCCVLPCPSLEGQVVMLCALGEEVGAHNISPCPSGGRVRVRVRVVVSVAWGGVGCGGQHVKK